jgi:histone-lysine N-methyltransferase SETMAR
MDILVITVSSHILHPSGANYRVTKVRDLVRSDRRLTVRIISSVLNLKRQTVHKILTFELGMQKICAKLLPEIITNEQKENRRNVCLDLLGRIENDKKNFKRGITGDETWILEYDRDTKRQSSEWHTSNSPCPKKARMSKSKPC